jgi:type VI secretion system protein ImpD
MDRRTAEDGGGLSPFAQGFMASERDSVATASSDNLLDTLLEATSKAQSPSRSRLDEFLAEGFSERALACWLNLSNHSLTRLDRRDLALRLSRDIAQIDEILSKQVNAILHQPRFQQLEASWRGLRYLIEQVDEGANVKIRMLSVSWKDLARDLERAIEFDQSQLFRKVYSEEFGTPGGEPFGVLLGDYQLHHRPGPGHPVDDLGALTAISQVAAAAFAPFIGGVHPSFFGLDQFSELELPLNLPRTFEQLEYLKWRAFRDTDDSRFVGLALPQVLMRLPYEDDGTRVDGFRFQEETEKPGRGQYLWGNAVYAMGAVLIRAFSESGWLAAIRGVQPGVSGGGLVEGLPVHAFGTDRMGIAPKSSTDVQLTDFQEKEFSELGFIPLCHCPDTEFSAFYGNQSVQKSKQYDEAIATRNARLSAMLQYMLCVSRFAHYVKVIMRDRLGSTVGPAECEEHLQRWLGNYTISNDEASLETKAKYPLRESSVRIAERPGKPGTYYCTIHLRPHFQLDQMLSTLRLTTELGSGQRT